MKSCITGISRAMTSVRGSREIWMNSLRIRESKRVFNMVDSTEGEWGNLGYGLREKLKSLNNSWVRIHGSLFKNQGVIKEVADLLFQAEVRGLDFASEGRGQGVIWIQDDF